MKNIYFLILSLASATQLNAQVTFQKTYGGNDDDGMYSIGNTHDGGYVLAGQTESFGASPYDIYLVRTDSNGTMLWSKVYRGNGNDYATDVKENADHGFIITGGTTSFGAGGDDGFIIRTDSAGNILWSRTYGGPLTEILFSVSQTHDGGFISAGYTQSFGAGLTDVFVVRTDASGVVLWTRSIGGTSWDNATYIIETSDSNFVLCGQTWSFGSTYIKIFLEKLNATGDTLWSQQYGGSEQEEGQTVRETFNGDYIVVGSTNSFGSGSYDAYLCRFDSGGSLLWSKKYGGLKTEAMYDVVNMADSGFAIAGYTESFGEGHRGTDSANVFLIRTDSNGDTLWTHTYGGAKLEEVFSLAKASDEGLCVLAYTGSFGPDSTDAYLVKTDALGNSNCHEEPCSPTVSAPLTIVSRVFPQVALGASVSVAPFTIITPADFQNVLCFAVGINNAVANAKEFILFPNPANKELAIGNMQFAIESVEIFDVMGRLTLNPSPKREGLVASINVSELKSGIYFVRMMDEKKNIFFGKFVKE